jgi:hypothetical protein
VSIAHPGGISELYYGQIKGPQIQLSTDMVMRGSHSKDYSAATRIFGLVDGNLLWRWDVATGGASSAGSSEPRDGLEAHASAFLKRVS